MYLLHISPGCPTLKKNKRLEATFFVRLLLLISRNFDNHTYKNTSFHKQKKEILGINKSSMNILIHEKKDDLLIYIALHIFTRINIEKGILPIAKFHLFNKRTILK